MIGASFNKIGSEGMTLEDLIPVGYEKVAYFTDDDTGVMGEFEIRILNKNGGLATDKFGNDADYYYNRTIEGGVWQDDGYWSYLSGDPAENIVFDVGEGLWFDVSADVFADVPANQYTLENAGEAFLDGGLVPIREGSKGVVAPLSTAVPLQSILPKGYEEVSYFTDDDTGVMGEFEIRILNKNGGLDTDRFGNDADYYYNRTIEGGVWQDDGYWSYLSGDPAEDIVFEMGEGLWVDVSADVFVEGTEEYFLEFPGIDDLAK